MTISTSEARAIAKEAYIYGFPIVDSYRVQYSYFVDRNSPEFKTSWNQIQNTPRVYTPADKAIQTPNSDTPYSFVGADLRAEPLMLTVPPIEAGRYFSLQFIDAYTFNFAYVGTRTTGNGGGNFLLAGPNWKGEKPENITDVIRSETQFAFILYRTQLFNPDDLDNVKRVQAGYKVQTLSQFLGKSAPAPAPKVEFLRPLAVAEERTSPEFFNILDFVLQFCPTHPSEVELMARFNRLGIGGREKFDPQSLSPGLGKAVEDGMADAWKTFGEFKAKEIDTGKLGSGDAFGTREYLKNDYLHRMAGAVLGIYGNSKEEAIYPIYFVDSSGNKLDASKHRYRLSFERGQLPPVNAFWSLTMYELPSSLLTANPLNRYLINSPMLPSLQRDAEGNLTIYVQHDSPGEDEQANWLPAPNGPFFAVMRLYWPKQDVLNGQWKQPSLRQVEVGELKKAG
jgi:hypothetical protein